MVHTPLRLQNRKTFFVNDVIMFFLFLRSVTVKCPYFYKIAKMNDEYQTIVAETEGLFKDRGSKFFGFAFPVNSEEEVRQKLENLKALHPKARHFCYGFRLGSSSDIARAVDDGEPAGSAGKPILNIITSFELTNTLVVVVRYFGGTLLGVPGLINAYKEAAKEVLELAEKETRFVTNLLKIEYDFDQTNPIMQTIKKLDLTVKEQTFETRCGLILEVRKSYIEKLKDELQEFWTITFEILD